MKVKCDNYSYRWRGMDSDQGGRDYGHQLQGGIQCQRLLEDD